MSNKSHNWGREIDQDVIDHLHDSYYLNNVIQILSAKIQHILKIKDCKAANEEICLDPRTQQYLGENIYGQTDAAQ